MFLRFGYEKLTSALRKIFFVVMPQILLPYVFFEQRYKGTNFWWNNQIFKRLFLLKIELFFEWSYSVTHLLTFDINILSFYEV